VLPFAFGLPIYVVAGRIASQSARFQRQSRLRDIGRCANGESPNRVEDHISPDWLADPATLLPFILIGFAAQLVDGALGMAFGQISSTLLIALGVPPAAASAGVHTAETFTTAVSGISHVAHRNVDWRLFLRIVIPGVLAGIAGAYLLTRVSAADAKPVVLTYLTALGLYLFYRGIMHRHTERRPRIVEPLGLVGGFLDAAGGGGWGAIVTSNLLVQGSNPRKTIGTVNTAEFFVTVSISATFIAALGWAAFTMATIGLLIGGVVAAPFGAWIAKKVNPDRLLSFVGFLLTLTSGYGLYRALG
jgi:uncharacterized membrane protein YfcA